jgi:ribosomal protein S27AE
MTIRELIDRKSRLFRLGFFVAWTLLAIPLFFELEAPLDYSIGAGLVLLVVVLGLAYRSIRCPRCGGSLWLAGMGFVAPGRTSGAGHNCPNCGVGYGEQAVP